ncbi:hypothetical protein AWZ03_001624 [Drosophila navojoa]|uniref:Uncharacterized protein n=1 Tax=Drosophila navojoa TaxID=7232 RepID=A0A484BTH0_DRONA|nr:uncharacterized protein LOC108659388 [Drosophila navojoa]TDG51954.1 hypothetical protein AWZ03_001624 [Drosophila navojoa]
MPSFILVPPVAKPLAAFEPRPSRSSPEVQAKRRNLFGTCDSADIDALLDEENSRQVHYMAERYNIDLDKLEEKCNQLSSVEPVKTQKFTVSISEKKSLKFADLDAQQVILVAQKNGVKRNFPVRKAYKGDSRVPKRKINQISSDRVEADSHNSEIGPIGEKRMCKGCRNNNCNN